MLENLAKMLSKEEELELDDDKRMLEKSISKIKKYGIKYL